MAATGRTALANDYVCCCGHAAIDHAWGRARCKDLDSYGVRCTCSYPCRCNEDDDV